MGRILIVEDDPKTLEVMKKALQPLGHAIDTARDGEKALALVEKTPYDLLVTDLMMPERTGMDLLETLMERGSKIPVVVCSAYVQHDALKGLGRGLRVEVVAKPFKAAALAAAAQKLLGPARKA